MSFAPSTFFKKKHKGKDRRTTVTIIGLQGNWLMLINFNVASRKEKFNRVDPVRMATSPLQLHWEILIKYKEEEVQFLVRHDHQKQKVNKRFYKSKMFCSQGPPSQIAWTIMAFRRTGRPIIKAKIIRLV